MLFIVWLATACTGDGGANLTPPALRPFEDIQVTTELSSVLEATRPADQSAARIPDPPPDTVVGTSEDETILATRSAEITMPVWPSSIGPYAPFATVEVTEAQQATFDRLVQAQPPERDESTVARLYRGWSGALEPTPAVAEPLAVGTVQQFNIISHDTNTNNLVQATLLAVGEHAYFWFDDGPGSIRPDQKQLDQIAATFDDIYTRSVAIFGPENKPGVDGDPRLHVVNVSPHIVCDGAENNGGNCSLAGYFSAFDGVPASINPNSNAREMFVMNASNFGSSFYLNVLAHELRHMIEDNYDRGDADWVAEGAAMLAEDLLGFYGNGVQRANIFLEQPDQQLNRWTDGYTTPYYGQAYLLNRYIYERLGGQLYRRFAASPADGLAAIDGIAQTNGMDVTGEELWLDWLVALAVHDEHGADEKYRFMAKGLNQVAMTKVNHRPAVFVETVHQYAADYYQLVNGEEIHLAFTGNQVTPLLDTMPASGEAMWLANRANYGHMTLTRDVDLTGISSATLEYNIYHDIETGYDFAYLFVSEDGGQTWQPLTAANMQGLGPEDDPSDSALADRFYTGRSDGWRRETVDLTPYTGRLIQLRFVYLTDLILTFGGIALDNIAIPEVGFFDDAETLAPGWTAEGFERVTATIPQQWHLQLVTFPDGDPVVQPLALSAEQTLSLSIALDDSGRQAILIVAASAPMTLEQAHYHLEIIDR